MRHHELDNFKNDFLQATKNWTLVWLSYYFIYISPFIKHIIISEQFEGFFEILDVL